MIKVCGHLGLLCDSKWPEDLIIAAPGRLNRFGGVVGLAAA